MPYLKVGALMRYYIDNKAEIRTEGATVLQVLQDAAAKYPALKFHLFDSAGKVRRHINVYLNDENLRDRKGLQSKLADDDRIIVLSSISGG